MRATTLTALTALTALALAGCEVAPYCVSCPGSGADGGDAGLDGGGDAAIDAARTDANLAGDAGSCLPLDDAGTEECNERDDDCDGTTDEGFDLQNDPNHCGDCDTQCLFPNVEVECATGACNILGCLPGFVDVDGLPGCEYACPVFPVVSEECNGLDDDCNGVVDDDDALPPPPVGLCRTTPGTPCAATIPVCDTRSGATTWFCDYPTGVEFDPDVPNGISLDETRCDGFDGDCDGVSDEPFLDLDNPCDNGMRGACRDSGVIVCDPADDTATVCDLSPLPDAAPGAPSTELCNAIDDDCDGTVDDSDPSDPGRVVDDMVRVVRGATTFWIYRYEASRPDASGTVIGVTGARSCSNAGVLPWTRVSYTAASAACTAAGHRLCTAAEWQAACEGAPATTYPYGPAYAPMSCNGGDRMSTPAVRTTGALALCVSDEGARDLSGNVKEWTSDPRPGGIFVVRGGSFESPELGLTCQTTLSQATSDTLLPSLGFRCCDSDGP